MSETPITLTITGDTCTLAIDPDEYLRVKAYCGGRRTVILQGVAYERKLPKNITETFPLPEIGQIVRIDI